MHSYRPHSLKLLTGEGHAWWQIGINISSMREKWYGTLGFGALICFASLCWKMTLTFSNFSWSHDPLSSIMFVPFCLWQDVSECVFSVYLQGCFLLPLQMWKPQSDLTSKADGLFIISSLLGTLNSAYSSLKSCPLCLGFLLDAMVGVSFISWLTCPAKQKIIRKENQTWGPCGQKEATPRAEVTGS
jgi:hypothetical protein